MVITLITHKQPYHHTFGWKQYFTVNNLDDTHPAISRLSEMNDT